MQRAAPAVNRYFLSSQLWNWHQAWDSVSMVCHLFHVILRYLLVFLLHLNRLPVFDVGLADVVCAVDFAMQTIAQ